MQSGSKKLVTHELSILLQFIGNSLVIPFTVFPAVTTQYNVECIVRCSLSDGIGGLYIAVRQKYDIQGNTIVLASCKKAKIVCIPPSL